MITVGLDFGTHQTKLCVEYKDRAELKYKFYSFKDVDGNKKYTLPSTVNVGEDGLLTYGYLPHNSYAKVIRYFKQDAFGVSSPQQTNAMYFSCWYIASILFDLEELYGQDFIIQMGAPTDNARYENVKKTAVRILASAYRLVEDVFNNDKTKFLKTDMRTLVDLTELVPYSDEIKEHYGMLIFPEAYACLMPLVKSSKINTGMSLMVDIGGGTTDISFFTIKDKVPHVYDFYSINKGLNFLTDAERRVRDRVDSNVRAASEILKNRKQKHYYEILGVCGGLLMHLEKEFKCQTNLPIDKLRQALKSRPIVYSGGGSTFRLLRQQFGEFKDIIHVSDKEWRTEAIADLEQIKNLGICSILSTAYGLSISVPDDNIKCEPFRDIFANIRDSDRSSNNYQSEKRSFDYIDDYNSWK
ncbi:MAG: hypothetical protein ACRC13_04805 [Tannerellaceae bacterium]